MKYLVTLSLVILLGGCESSRAPELESSSSIATISRSTPHTSNLLTLHAGDNVPDEVHVVVEIPRGSKNKYEFDKELGVVKLDRVLFSSVHYPGDYGIIPSTFAGDGDPLDVIVLVTEGTYPGVVIPARPIAVLEMLDGGEQDDKILAVPVDDIRYERIMDVTDLSEHTKNEISEFFRTYKNLEGKRVQVSGWKGATEAKRVIQAALDAYELVGSAN